MSEYFSRQQAALKRSRAEVAVIRAICVLRWPVRAPDAKVNEAFARATGV
jgi:hypothetical protein